MKNTFFNKIIQKELIKYKIRQLKIESSYEITDDLVVNFNGSVNLADKGLTKIPFKIGIIQGDFNCGNNKLKNLINGHSIVMVSYYCNHNNLTSLEGVAHTIYDNFDCAWCYIESLENSPGHVGKNYSCNANKIKTLKGIQKVICGNFICTNNLLESLKDGPEIVKEVYYCNENPIKTWIYLPKEVQSFRCNIKEKKTIFNFEDVKKLQQKEMILKDYDELNNSLITIEGKRKRLKI